MPSSNWCEQRASPVSVSVSRIAVKEEIQKKTGHSPRRGVITKTMKKRVNIKQFYYHASMYMTQIRKGECKEITLTYYGKPIATINSCTGLVTKRKRKKR